MYGIALAALMYGAYKVAESALWPVLTKRSYSLEAIDQYLSAARGSLPSLPQALWAFRKGTPLAVVVCIALLTLLSKLDTVLVGYVYTRQNVSTTYYSMHTYGAGMGISFYQMNPPGTLPAAVGSAASLYNSWASGVGSEPMPEQRDLVLDRDKFSVIGNFSVHTVQAARSIKCKGHKLTIVGDNVTNSDYYPAAQIQIATAGIDYTHGIDQEEVTVRLQPELTLWVDSVTNLSDTRVISTIVFAALNGSIENGSWTVATSGMKEFGFAGISAVACTVDVQLSDVVYGPTGGSLNTSLLNNIDALVFDSAEVAEWLGVAITTFGTSVYGAQPMFTSGTVGTDTILPVVYTTSSDSNPVNDWTLANLTNFIDVGSGALGLAMTRSWNPNSTVVTSEHDALRIEPRRIWLLLFLPVAIVAIFVLLTIIAGIEYRHTGVPSMRLVSTGELIYGSHTSELRAAVNEARVSAASLKNFEHLRVRYGVIDGGNDGLGMTDVARFPSIYPLQQ